MPRRSVPRPAAALATAAAAAALAVSVSADAAPDPPSHRAMRAGVAAPAPRIDGRVDDAAWAGCAWEGGFVQQRPYEGRAATLATEVCVLHDQRDLYVALRMADPEPGLIRAPVGGRDAIPDSDMAVVMIDSHRDRRTGFYFAVNPAGSYADAALYDDTGFDLTWDGVWHQAARVHAGGWDVELRIPFATLRFAASDDLAFGAQFRRRVARSDEVSNWSFQPQTTNGVVSWFGELGGLSRAREGRGVQVLPYALGRSTVSRAPGSSAPDERAHLEVGVDVRKSLTGTLALDVAVNPDFGQVEVDPAVVNLSAFEVFFPEKRPFFLEGADIFRTPIQALHTRRIGAAPAEPELAEGETLESLAPAAPIPAAAKVTGRAGRTAVGALAAAVDETRAVLRSADGDARVVRTSPRSLYGALRVRQAVGERSVAGGIVTGVGREHAPDAVAGGPDLELRLGRYLYKAQALAAGGGDGAGHAAQAVADFTGRVWGWVVAGEARSPGLDLNDAGFVQGANRVSGFALGRWRLPDPVGPFRSLRAHLFTSHAADYDGFALGRSAGTSGEVELTSRWTLRAEVQAGLPARDNDETRGGPPYRYPGWRYAFASVGSNPSRPVSGEVRGTAGRANTGSNASATLSLSLIPIERVQLSPSVTLRRTRGERRWVAADFDGAGARHDVFAERDFDQLDASLRATVTLTPDLSLSLYSQLLHARGRHAEFSEIVAPDALARYAYAGDPDFSTSALIANAVARWEFLPLSAAYLVWTHRASLASGDAAFDPAAASGDLAAARGDDLVMLKVSYLWQM